MPDTETEPSAGPKYLQTTIAERVFCPTDARYGMARDGYTTRSGAPTQWMIRLAGEKRWRRLMRWQFSNAGTCFLRIKGECLIVPGHAIPEEGAHV
jgi:hypothetical protein